MPATIVVGTQWGDEGKGKFTDLFAKEMDLVVRYQGGHNAGHTLVVDGDTFALQLPAPPTRPLTSVRTSIGVRSEPTPPPRPRLDVAPPAPGKQLADGPARFGQQPTVAPEIERVPFDTESLADLGKSNRLMLRVLVRHGAPAPVPGRKGDALGTGASGC
jgi:hypothetical protein